jgi:drug/metabolite transporter (DMT)-like permease
LGEDAAGVLGGTFDSVIAIHPTVDARRRRAVVFMLVAAVCWSTGGLLVRKLSITNAWEIVFWRSLFMSLFVAVVLVAMHGRAMPRAVAPRVIPACWPGCCLPARFSFSSAR